MQFKIESDIPTPSKPHGGQTPGELTKVLMQMKVGDSVIVPAEYKAKFSFGTAKKHTGYRYAVRKVEGGHRVWRVE